MSLRCLVDRPGLDAALALRGLSAVDLVIAHEPMPFMPTLLIARDEAEEVRLLDAGYDVVAANASPTVIAARAAATMRRSDPVLRVGDLAIDRVRHRVTRAGRVLLLLPREYRLLLFLAERAGQVVSRADLHAHVWGLAFDPRTNVVAVHISRLRAKLDAIGPSMLVTEKGQGYRLIAPVAEPDATG